MGQYLVCGMVAEHPYCIEKLGLRLYTIEELCYYIYHNIPLIEEDFINERLLRFIREELKLGELADRIERYYHSPADLDSVLVLMQRDVAYYSEKEIAKFQQQFKLYLRKTPIERKRDCADRLLEGGRFAAALGEYEGILGAADRQEKAMPDFRAQVLQHMGAAYMRLGLNDEALKAFQAAYKSAPSSYLLQQIYFWAMQTGRPYPKELEAIDAESLAKWQKHFMEVQERCEALASQQKNVGEAESVSEAMKRYLDNQKQEYRIMIGEKGINYKKNTLDK